MKPKERAKSLIKQFKYSPPDMDVLGILECKAVAKICIKEIVTELNKLPSKDLSDLQYWSEVEYELSLL